MSHLSKQSLNDSTFNNQNKTWFIFYTLSSWIILTILFLSELPQKILISSMGLEENPKKQKVVNVLLENKLNNKTKEPDEMVFLSNQDNTGSGKLTKNKGFEALTEENQLSFAKKGNIESQKLKKENYNKNGIKTKANEKYSVKIFPDEKADKIGYGGQTTWGKEKKSLIPSNYKFNREFALSWDKAGEPIIPTKNYKHYKYFRNMFDKIKENWSPPGGQPSPTDAEAFHRMGYAPGYIKFQTFPDQEIKIVFILDKKGNVIEITLWESMGFVSLDLSCVESIERSKNFGPPPKELLKDGVFIMPMVFVIFTY
ncbi:MAG: TonB C-terminal domain-containing protein [Spirochaetia bacterium]|nr:TonB C-terminal domain-containing protein [Spirochaetia bacterium]